ncbi:MAG: extracellular solute-binding protein [Pseudomonadota bacterium]
MRITKNKILTGVAAIAMTAVLSYSETTRAAEELNFMTWCDHDDPSIIRPFEEANDVKVNVKVYELTGAAISILEQSQPGDWDVIVVDSADVLRMGQGGWLEPLNKSDFPYEDIFDGAETPHLHESDGVLWGVPEKFGFNTMAFDNRAVGSDGDLSLDLLWDPKMQGRVGVYDYYLPVIKTLGLRHGINPNDFNMESLEVVREDLFALKDNTKLVGDIVATQTALAAGEVDVLVGIAEFVAPLQGEKPYLDWGTPVEGGLRWSQSVGIFKDSQKKDLALKFSQYLLSPEGQARVAMASCYNAMPVNSKAALSDDQKASLRWDEIDIYLSNTYDYGSVDAELDEAMLELWTEFLAH